MSGIPANTPSVYDKVPLPLGKTRCIRVVKIRPSTVSDFSDPIICDFSVLEIDGGTLIEQATDQPQPLHHHDAISPRFRDRVEYQALSYTWGSYICETIVQEYDPFDSLGILHMPLYKPCETPVYHTIELESTPFRVRQNLWDFLHRARANGVTGYLWIDAICIDQMRLRERNHQVSFMGDIYSQAECVIVWLGECSIEDRASLRDVPKLSTQAGVNESVALAARRCVFLPYWTRAWVIQEYYLARRKDIWYGELRLSHEYVENFDKYSNRLPGTPSPAVDEGHKWKRGILSSAGNMWQVQQTLKQKDKAFDMFLELMKVSRMLGCVEKLDRVFALLPILKPEKRREIGISVDYSRSTTSLYADIIVRLTEWVKFHPSTAYSKCLKGLKDLQDMLVPDLKDNSVQSAGLDLRALDPTPDTRLMSHAQPHKCIERRGVVSGFEVRGCRRCHKKPVANPVNIGYELGFSRSEWKAYVEALLSSKQKADRNLGIKYCHDRGLKLGMSETIPQILDTLCKAEHADKRNETTRKSVQCAVNSSAIKRRRLV